MNNDWELARSARNGGTLSFTEAAEAWKNRPNEHMYPLSTDPTDKWVGEFTKRLIEENASR